MSRHLDYPPKPPTINLRTRRTRKETTHDSRTERLANAGRDYHATGTVSHHGVDSAGEGGNRAENDERNASRSKPKQRTRSARRAKRGWRGVWDEFRNWVVTAA